MSLLVIEKHNGYGIFPLFVNGTIVSDLKATIEYPHWYSCVIGEHKTFIADVYVVNGVLLQDYNSTELIVG